jgi:hypothetical protein
MVLGLLLGVLLMLPLWWSARRQRNAAQQVVEAQKATPTPTPTPPHGL